MSRKILKSAEILYEISNLYFINALLDTKVEGWNSGKSFWKRERS